MVLISQDFSKEHMDKFGYGKYTPMDVELLPPLHLIYAENPSDSGKVNFFPFVQSFYVSMIWNYSCISKNLAQCKILLFVFPPSD